MREQGTVRDWLARRYPRASGQTLKRMVEAGRVRINDVRAKRLSEPVGPEDRVVCSDRPSRTTAATKAPAEIVFEDRDILIVNKPPGLLTSTVPRERRPTLAALLREHLAEREPAARLGVIHRLDRDASGLLVFSKNDSAYHSLKSQFYHHTVEREYRALVRGAPEPATGRIESRLIERADGTVHSTKQAGQGRIAVTEYETIERRGGRSLLRVILRTGRKHQIRAHLSERGTPVVGDTIYGSGDEPGDRLMLMAVRLTIDHPRTGNRMTFAVERPLTVDSAERTIR